MCLLNKAFSCSWSFFKILFFRDILILLILFFMDMIYHIAVEYLWDIHGKIKGLKIHQNGATSKLFQYVMLCIWIQKCLFFFFLVFGPQRMSISSCFCRWRCDKFCNISIWVVVLICEPCFWLYRYKLPFHVTLKSAFRYLSVCRGTGALLSAVEIYWRLYVLL